MRHACATDGNHAAIRDGLRAAGLWVWDTHRVGGGFPDLLVWRGGKAHGFDVAGPGFVLLELKDGTLPPSRRTLTPLEEAFHAGCPGGRARGGVPGGRLRGAGHSGLQCTTGAPGNGRQKPGKAPPVRKRGPSQGPAGGEAP
jgi:hypothetical protein